MDSSDDRSTPQPTAADMIRRDWCIVPTAASKASSGTSPKDRLESRPRPNKHPGVKAGAAGLTLADAQRLAAAGAPNRYNLIVGSKDHPNRSGVLDIETDGAIGEELLAKACGGTIPAGPYMVTASGSVHRLFVWPAVPEGKRVKMGKELLGPDCKVDMMWQNLVLDGDLRVWHDFDHAVPELPAGLLDAVLVDGRLSGTVDFGDIAGPAESTPYGLAALRDECAKLASTIGGARSDQLFESSMKLGHYVTGGELSLDDLTDGIGQACVENGHNDDYPGDWERQMENGVEVGAAEPKSAPPAELGTFNPHQPLTEAGNAQRLVDLYGDEIMYVTEAKAWFVWDRCRWAPDTGGLVVEMAKQLPRVLHQEAEAYLTDAEKHKAWTSWARQSGMARVIRATLELASYDSRVRRSAAVLDANPWLLNTPTEVVNLRTGDTYPARKTDYMTKVTAGNYRPGLVLRKFTRALEHATGSDAAFMDYLQLAAGYTLAGATLEDVFFYVYGPARSGKGTLTEPLQATLGDYGQTAKIETFLARNRSGHGSSSDVARMAGARMVLTAEPMQGEKLATGFIKDLTGGFKQVARFLFRDEFEFVPQLTLWLTANDRLYVDHRDAPLYRRLIVCPFDNSLSEEQLDPGLKHHLTTDQEALDAILTWSVEGCRRWWDLSDNGHRKVLTLQMPPAVKAATEAYRQSQNPLSEFIEDYCVLSEDAWAAGSDLLDAVNRSLPLPKSMTAKTLGKHLAALPGVTAAQERGGARRRGWQGIGLLPTDAEGVPSGVDVSWRRVS